MTRKNIKFGSKEKTRKFSRNTKIIKEMERLIKLEKGIKVDLVKVNKFPKEFSDQLTQGEFEDIYKRAKSQVPDTKKKGSVWTITGGSTGLVQQ